MPSVIEADTSAEAACRMGFSQDGYKQLFANKRFMALWIGQVFSQVADRIIYVLFIALIVKGFGTSGLYKSLLYVAFTIPAILLTAIAGVFVDRWNKQHVLIGSNLVRAGVLALTAPVMASHSLLALYASAFMVSVATQFFAPAESATIPSITPKSQLLVANSLFTTTMMASIIFGFSLGDPLISWLGLEHVHWAIVALFLLATVSLLFVRTSSTEACAATGGNCEQPSQSTGLSIVQQIQQVFVELWQGFLYVHSQKQLLKMLLKLSLLFSCVVAMCMLFITFAESYLYKDPLVAAQKFVWIITVSGVGMLVSALAIGHFGRQVNRLGLIYTGFLIIGATLLALLLSPMIEPSSFDVFDYIHTTNRIAYAYTISFIMGVGAAMVAVPLQAVVHETIHEENRGKVMGIQFTLISTASTLPAVIAGIGADLWGVLTMFALMGIPLVALGLYGLLKLKLNPQSLPKEGF